MDRECFEPDCYHCCVKTQKAMIMQLDYMTVEARHNRQDFMVYLLQMARYEAQLILDCAANEERVQKYLM